MYRTLMTAAAAVLLTLSAAKAQEETVSGEIEIVEKATEGAMGEVMLVSGDSFLLPEEVPVPADLMEKGAEVTIVYEETDEGRVVKSMLPVQ